MNQHEREMWILGEYGEVSDGDWLPLISAWENEDGSISLIPNCQLRAGSRFTLYPKGKDAPQNAPDLRCTVKRDRVSIEDGLVEILAKKGQEL